jgi:hypothetical protein
MKKYSFICHEPFANEEIVGGIEELGKIIMKYKAVTRIEIWDGGDLLKTITIR